MISNTDTEHHLDEVAVKQFIFKNAKLKAVILKIAEHAIKKKFFWPDEIFFDFLPGDDVNCIGIAYRILSRTLPIIAKTGNFKRSNSGNSNGRTIFHYQLVNRSLAACLLKRHNLTEALKLSEPEFPGFGV